MVAGMAIREHQFPHRDIGAAGEQLADGEDAQELIPAVDHEKVVGDLGDFLVAAQIAHYHVDGEIRTHGDGVRVHQPAGGVLRVGQHVLHPLAVLLVHGLQYFRDHLIRKLLHHVGDIVRIQPLEQGCHFGAVHAPEEFLLHLLAQLAEHLALELLVHQLPENAPGLGGGGLDMVSNIRDRQVVEHVAQAFDVHRIDDLVDPGQEGEALFLVCLVCHGTLPWSR